MKNLSNSANYKNARVYTGGSGQIPVGGYQCIVKGVKYVEYDWGDRIELAFEVTDGEYKDFFQKQFDENTSEDKKWKGVFRLNVPKDDGTQEDSWRQNRFKTVVSHFEESNPGYTWNWDENTLKGKKIGILFRNRFTNINGNDICYSEACYTETIENIASGNFKEPKDYKDKSYGGGASTDSTSNDGFMDIQPGGEEEIPF